MEGLASSSRGSTKEDRRNSTSQISRRASTTIRHVFKASMNRTLSARLSRRISSSRSLSQLCDSCQGLDFSQVPAIKSLAGSARHEGKVISKILSNSDSVEECPLCQILSKVVLAGISQLFSQGFSLSLELRAFPLIPNAGIQAVGNLTRDLTRDLGLDVRDTSNFLAVVSWDYSSVIEQRESRLLDLAAQVGYLMWQPGPGSPSPIFSPHIVSSRFDPTIVHKWLNCCQTFHKGCQTHTPTIADIALIDCDKRVIANSPTISSSCPAYVALSYVWGHTKVGNMGLHGKTAALPNDTPPVIEDAMSVTKALGFRYLWVDKYCVNQQDRIKKHQQIIHMDAVYQNAAFTIIAAAGTDETQGLPGISSTRPSKQVFFQTDDYILASTLPSPRKTIAESTWATRGWTYQEAILSRRRLVFTPDQLYFECDSMHCYESLDVSFEQFYQDERPDFKEFLRPSLFAFGQFQTHTTSKTDTSPLDNYLVYTQCAQEYSRRHLTFDEDALNAFVGVIKRLETAEVHSIRHLWGVPFCHPADISPSKGSHFWTDFLFTGLSWRHEPSNVPSRRRKPFPSWSWTGWTGSVSWPRPTKTSKVCSKLVNLKLQLDDGSIVSFDEADYRSTPHDQGIRHPKALFIDTACIPRTAFTFDKNSQTLSFCGGGEAKLYIDKPDFTTAHVYKRIQSGKYEAIRLGNIDDDAYILLVKQYRSAIYRVGLIVTKTFFLAFPNSDLRTFKLK